MTDKASPSGPKPAKAHTVSHLATIAAEAEAAKARHAEMLTESAAMKVAQESIRREADAMKAARRFHIEETAAAKAARSVEREAANAIRASRVWEREATASARAMRNIDLMTRQATAGWERQMRDIAESPGMRAAMQIERDIAESPGMRAAMQIERDIAESPGTKAAIQIERDIERTREWIDPILEEHRRVELMLGQPSEVECMLADQAREERLLADQMRLGGSHLDPIGGQDAALMRENLVGAGVEDLVPRSAPQLPSRGAPRKRAALAKPKVETKPAPITVAVAQSTAYTIVIQSQVRHGTGSRLATVWNAVTSKTGAAIVVAVAGILAPTSPLTWVAAVCFGWMFLKVRDRAKHLVAHEGLDEPEALRRSWHDFFPKR